MKKLHEAEARTFLRKLPEFVDSIELVDGFRWKISAIQDTTFKNCNFPDVTLKPSFLSSGRIINCSFENVRFDGINANGIEFSICHFEQSVFGDKHLGRFEECIFRDSEFLDCEIDLVTFYRSELRSCTFSSLRSRRLNFNRCIFNNVKIQGILKTVNLIDCCFEKTDFSEAVLADFSIVPAPTTELLLPDNRKNFWVTPVSLKQAEPLLKTRISEASLREYSEIIGIFSKANVGEMIDPEMFKTISTEDRLTIFEVLYQLRKND